MVKEKKIAFHENKDTKMSQKGATLLVKATPRSSKNSLENFDGKTLKVRLSAPPVENLANEALLKFLGEIFDQPKSSIKILKGKTSRTKLLLFQNLSQENLNAVLLKWFPSSP